MPERQPEAGGIPLWEAIERWTPREVWQRYREIAHEESEYMIYPPGPGPLHAEAERLRTHIEGVLSDKLRRGELIASGLDVPLDRHTRRWDITSELWSRLRLDIRAQEASGDGLRVVELRFREPGPAGSDRSSPTTARQPRQRRSAGRPSSMKEIEAEMRRRGASGELADTLIAEVEALAEWTAAQQHLIIPKPRSIKRQLAKVYRQIKGEKKSDK